MKVRMAASLSEQTLRGLAAWYQALPDPLAATDRRVLRKALALAGGDMRRCTAESDGSVIVWNRPVW